MSIKSVSEQSSVVESYQAVNQDFSLQLPCETVVEIFSYLGKQDLSRCAVSSKSWQTVADSDDVWKAQAKIDDLKEKLEGSSWKDACRQSAAEKEKAALHQKRQGELKKRQERLNSAAKITMGILLFSLAAVVIALAWILATAVVAVILSVCISAAAAWTMNYVCEWLNEVFLQS